MVKTLSGDDLAALSFETLSLQQSGPVATLTLTRPHLLDCFDTDLHAEFVDALHVIHQLEDVRSIVLSSTGTVFSAGGDFDMIRGLHEDAAAYRAMADEGRELLTSLIKVPVPVVVALRGDAIGLGATVALACDAVVAARSARIMDPHVNIGLVAGDGGCVVWPHAVGMLRAKRHLLTGDPVTAEQGYAMGLVTDLVDEPDDVLPAAHALANRMAALPPLAVQGTKRALSHVLLQRADEVLDLSFAYEGASVASDDLLEAISSFKERRPGSYTGH